MPIKSSIFLKKKFIIDSIIKKDRKVEGSMLVSFLTDYMSERVAKEYIKNMVYQCYLELVQEDAQTFIIVTDKGEKYANGI